MVIKIIPHHLILGISYSERIVEPRNPTTRRKGRLCLHGSYEILEIDVTGVWDYCTATIRTHSRFWNKVTLIDTTKIDHRTWIGRFAHWVCSNTLDVIEVVYSGSFESILWSYFPERLSNWMCYKFGHRECYEELGGAESGPLGVMFSCKRCRAVLDLDPAE